MESRFQPGPAAAARNRPAAGPWNWPRPRLLQHDQGCV